MLYIETGLLKQGGGGRGFITTKFRAAKESERISKHKVDLRRKK
jgi:hypothetical protein